MQLTNSGLQTQYSFFVATVFNIIVSKKKEVKLNEVAVSFWKKPAWTTSETVETIGRFDHWTISGNMSQDKPFWKHVLTQGHESTF